jgi:hypothetical protein
VADRGGGQGPRRPTAAGRAAPARTVARRDEVPPRHSRQRRRPSRGRPGSSTRWRHENLSLLLARVLEHRRRDRRHPGPGGARCERPGPGTRNRRSGLDERVEPGVRHRRAHPEVVRAQRGGVLGGEGAVGEGRGEGAVLGGGEDDALERGRGGEVQEGRVPDLRATVSGLAIRLGGEVAYRGQTRPESPQTGGRREGGEERNEGRAGVGREAEGECGGVLCAAVISHCHRQGEQREGGIRTRGQ